MCTYTERERERERDREREGEKERGGERERERERRGFEGPERVSLFSAKEERDGTIYSVRRGEKRSGEERRKG